MNSSQLSQKSEQILRNRFPNNTLIVGNHTYNLSNLPLIGHGRYGAVFQHRPNQVIKLFYKDFDQEKVRWLMNKEGLKNITQTSLPLDFVMGADRSKVGYTMNCIQGQVFLKQLLRTAYEQNGLELIRSLVEILELLHKQNISVGDFSVKNFIKSSGQVYILDTDGWSIPGFKTTPNNFITDPTINFDKIMHKGYPQTQDAYAVAYLLCKYVLKTSPYSGLYKGLSEQEKSTQGITIFSKGVVLPPQAKTVIETLHQDWKTFFNKTFTHEMRELPSKKLLQTPPFSP